MKEVTDISIVLPVHELDDKTKSLFDNAIKSVKEQIIIPDALLIVTPSGSDVESYLNKYDFGDIKDIVTIISNDGNTDFASQINCGVENITTEWFSILEYDDEYSKIWFKNVLEYKNAHDDVDVFLPIIVDVNETGEFIGLTNEAVWAQSFSDELGILTNDALISYQNFNIDGIVMKKDLYEEYGGIKPSIKLTFIYEFLLRVTFNDARVMIIPKFGYKHTNQREGSLFHNYKLEMNPVEANWWLAQAKKEYYFDNDRNISYIEEKEK